MSKQKTVIKEFDKIKSGDFDSNKIELAKKSLFPHRHEASDRPKSIIEILHNQLLLNHQQTIKIL